MELKGECLKKFWIWYLLPEQRKNYKTNSLLGSDPAIKVRFLSLSFTERYGVYVDFFDSVGCVIEITFGENINRNKYYGYTFWENREKDEYGFSWFIKTEFEDSKTRQEARTKAIEKANKIYNKL